MRGPSGGTEAACVHLRMCGLIARKCVSMIGALPLYMYKLKATSGALDSDISLY